MERMNKKQRCRLGGLVLVIGLLIGTPGLAGEPTAFRYDEKNVETAIYFAAITNLANAVMFSGLGEDLIISPYERDDWLRRAGYVTRPPMPRMAVVGPVYAGALPRFREVPDFSDPETLTWDSTGFDRTLDPGAQAWAMIKITSPEFHLQYHRLPENRLAGLMMVPQARVQAKTLEKRLLNDDGLFAARKAEGAFEKPSPRDQIAVLWAVSNLILAGTSERKDYWHAAYRDLTDPNDYRALARKALEAIEKLPPVTPGDRALAIEALGRFALAAKMDTPRRKSLDLARGHANALRGNVGESLEDVALSVYGLSEAGRLFRAQGYGKAAAGTFRARLLAKWDDDVGVFRFGAESQPIVLTPRLVGAVVAALNAMRWYGAEAVAAQAGQIYPRFFEAAVVRSGLLRASPLPLVSVAYREAEPDANFAHPLLPDAVKAGVPPVFASRTTFENGKWKVTDPTFRTADALFLANMLAMRSQSRADTFLPEDRLAKLRTGN